MNAILKNKSKVNGFTLVELVIVIAIIAILAISFYPRYLDFKSDAYKADITAAVGAVKTSVALFKSKTLASGDKPTYAVEYNGVKGKYYQPYASNATLTSDYSSPPAIFIGAGLDVEEWSYRITSSTDAVLASPRSFLHLAEPTEIEVKATDCYFSYTWSTKMEPLLNKVISGC